MAAKKEVQGEKKTSSRAKSASTKSTEKVTEEKKTRSSKKAAEAASDEPIVKTEDIISDVEKHNEEPVVVQEKQDAEAVVEAPVEAAKDDVVESKDASVVVEAKPADVSADEAERGIKRYDVIITSERAGYRPPKSAVGTMVQQLAFRGYASPVAEAIAETWTEIYFEPGVAAHEIFIEKAYKSDIPVFKEICLKFTDKAFFCDYTETPQRPLYWSIEIRGSRYQNPIGAFRKLFMDALNLRVATASRDFVKLPEHAVVPEDEVPPEKKKRERSNGLAGMEVEEV